MNSKLLEAIGLGNLDIAYILIFMLVCIIALAVIVIIQINQNKKLRLRYEKFLQGKNAKSLEDQITELCQVHDILKKNSDIHKKQIKDLYKKHRTAFQKFSIVKYDAFNEMGGKLSFAITLLDGNNSGYIINSMHSREGCYNYVKEIVKGESYIELSEEEAESLDNAIFQETLGFDLENMK